MKLAIDNSVYMNYDEFCNICEKIDSMEEKADSYCPTENDILFRMYDQLDEYIPFLLWVEETGFETEDNQKSRNYLKRFLREYIKII